MKVLIAFNDKSLGGTSRSALEFAKIWQKAGAHVVVYSPELPHPTRIRSIEEAGIRLETGLIAQRVISVDLVHIHHAAPSPSTIAWVSDLVKSFTEPFPAVLTHNIFGQHLEIPTLGRHLVVGLLGDWLVQQYKNQSRVHRSSNLRVVPNPQDLEHFRPPSPQERTHSRLLRGIGADAQVILRVGSPNSEKWDERAYFRLASRVAENESLSLRLVGAPDSLRRILPTHERITFIDPIDDDDRLREEYWAADVFAHWARRGESFGNVLIEALGTGLPVVYKSRSFRDNTPWEFQVIPGFHYIKTRRGWVTTILHSRRLRRFTQHEGAERYSVSLIEKLFTSIVEGVNHDFNSSPAEAVHATLLDKLSSPRRLPICYKVTVAVRHNLFTARLKAWRLRRVGKRFQ